MNTVTINGKTRSVEFISGEHGTATFWVGGVCQNWRCRKENGRWQLTFHIS